jgi:hypothetical protein
MGDDFLNQVLSYLLSWASQPLPKMIMMLSLVAPWLFVLGMLCLSALILRVLPPKHRPRQEKPQGDAARYVR